jgi:hypothetical protein
VHNHAIQFTLPKASEGESVLELQGYDKDELVAAHRTVI